MDRVPSASLLHPGRKARGRDWRGVDPAFAFALGARLPDSSPRFYSLGDAEIRKITSHDLLNLIIRQALVKDGDVIQGALEKLRTDRSANAEIARPAMVPSRCVKIRQDAVDINRA